MPSKGLVRAFVTMLVAGLIWAYAGMGAAWLRRLRGGCGDPQRHRVRRRRLYVGGGPDRTTWLPAGGFRSTWPEQT